jgi:hypothetical protein
MQTVDLNFMLDESYEAILPKEFQLMPFTFGGILLTLTWVSKYKWRLTFCTSYLSV